MTPSISTHAWSGIKWAGVIFTLSPSLLELGGLNLLLGGKEVFSIAVITALLKNGCVQWWGGRLRPLPSSFMT